MAQFPKEFWQALRRVRNAPKHGHYMGELSYWMPTDTVWPYREYNRAGVDPNKGGSPESAQQVYKIYESMKHEGQREPVSLVWNPDAFSPQVARSGLSGMYLGEGNHRAAAARMLDAPHVLTTIQKGWHKPWADPPEGTKRSALYLGEEGPGGYIPTYPAPNDFHEFSGQAIHAGKARGAPADRAIVSALGNEKGASKILKNMVKAGKVLGPVAAMVGLVAGLSDPAEALGATVDQAESGAWEHGKVTPAMRKASQKYYAKKQSDAEKRNPAAAYGDKGSAKDRKPAAHTPVSGADLKAAFTKKR